MIKCPNCGLELRPDSSNPQRMKCTNCDYVLDGTVDAPKGAAGFTYTPSALHEEHFERGSFEGGFAPQRASRHAEGTSSFAGVQDETAASPYAAQSQARTTQQQQSQVQQQVQPRQQQSQAPQPQPRAQPQAPQPQAANQRTTPQSGAQSFHQAAQQQEAHQSAAQQQTPSTSQSTPQQDQPSGQQQARGQTTDAYWGTQGTSPEEYQARQAEIAAAARRAAAQQAQMRRAPAQTTSASPQGISQPGMPLAQGGYGGAYAQVYPAMPRSAATVPPAANAPAATLPPATMPPATAPSAVSTLPPAASSAEASSATASEPCKKPVSGFAITALVLGILALVCCWVPVVSFAGFVLGTCGLAFGIVALARTRNNATSGKGVAIAGSICAAVALVLALLMSILSVFLVNAVVKDSNLYRDYLQDFISLIDDGYRDHNGYLVHIGTFDFPDSNK